MAEYIDREALISDIQDAVDNGGMGGMVAGALKRYVKRVPAADAAPVRHRRWKQARYTEAPLYLCSECDKPEYKQHNYCPNCGAKMDGGAD